MSYAYNAHKKERHRSNPKKKGHGRQAHHYRLSPAEKMHKLKELIDGRKEV